jgi:transcription antitermination factor NusG
MNIILFALCCSKLRFTIVKTMLKANFRPRVIPNRCIYIKRILPGKGQISTLKNDEVAPQDILGSSVVVAGFSSLNLSRRLGVSPKTAESLLQKNVGQKVFKGELLAIKKGLISKTVVLSPTDGIIDQFDIRNGELRIKLDSRVILLTAGVYGIVEEVNQNKGEVLIKTMADQVFGMVGSGMERGGILDVIPATNSLVDVSLIKPSMSRHILVVGSLIYGEAVKKAVTFGVTGIVAGGINLSDYRSISGHMAHLGLGSEIGLSLMITEGFGPIPIGDDIRMMIESCQGRYVFIDGNTTILTLPSRSPDSILTLRKISLPKISLIRFRPEIKLEDLEIGKNVRIIWPPFMGTQGKVIAIDQTPTTVESGVSTYLVTLETKMRKLKVPFTNVELI